MCVRLSPEFCVWISSNRVRFHSRKTQLIWLGNRRQVQKKDLHNLQLLFSTTVYCTQSCCELTSSEHVKILLYVSMQHSFIICARSALYIGAYASRCLPKLLLPSCMQSYTPGWNMLMPFYGTPSLWRWSTSVCLKLCSSVNWWDPEVWTCGKSCNMSWLPLRSRTEFKILGLIWSCLV